MSTTTLNIERFHSYPPEAQAVVARNLALLEQLPLTFLSLLLREVIAYDWKFPAERDEIERQFRYLDGLSLQELANAMSSFARLKLSSELEQADWIGNPSRFSERLSAHLWATHQIDNFSSAAESYIAAFNTAVPEKPILVSRLGIAVIGREMNETSYPLFRKLRDHGTYFTNVESGSESKVLLDTVAERAQKYPAAYAHWCIYGADSTRLQSKQVASIAYTSLSSVRWDLIRKMQDVSASHLGPEAMRTRLAETDPGAVGLSGPDIDPVLAHFSVRVLTEGAGTQIYSTTFVQWTAREALRRARPLTLLAKFAPRQTEESADEELQGDHGKPAFDLPGSLVDADMGAYYTWINLQRLSGAEDSAFLAWFEGHNQALVISPSLAAGKECHDKVDVAELLRRMQIKT
jgi:hypothetical protein